MKLPHGYDEPRRTLRAADAENDTSLGRDTYCRYPRVDLHDAGGPRSLPAKQKLRVQAADAEGDGRVRFWIQPEKTLRSTEVSKHSPIRLPL